MTSELPDIPLIRPPVTLPSDATDDLSKEIAALDAAYAYRNNNIRQQQLRKRNLDTTKNERNKEIKCYFRKTDER